LWNKAEQKRIAFLARAIRQTDNGYWTYTKAGLEVSSSVSSRLTAEGVCYGEALLKAFPKVFGVTLPRGSVKVRFVFHDTREQFAHAAGAGCSRDGFHKVNTQEGGALVADVHIAADRKRSTRSLLDRVDFRTLRCEAARALLRLCAAGQPVPWFVREGCAVYFETCDVLAQQPGGSAWVAQSRYGSFVQPLRTAILDDATFRPDLYRLIHRPEDAFAAGDQALHRALAAGFIDHLLSSARLRPALRGMLATLAKEQAAGETGAPPTIMDSKTAAALEDGWHRCLCAIVARSMPVVQTEITVDGTPPRAPSHTKLSRYGSKPLVSVVPGDNGTFDIAWYDTAAQSVRIVQCDALNRKTGEVSPAFIREARSLLGATRRPRDKSYVVGYSRDNSHGDKAFELWITRFDSTGKEIFNTRIFGDKNSREFWSKGGPGAAGTARIVYNEKTDLFGFYCSHNMKWKDGVRHQGGYVGFIGSNGKQLFHSGDKHVGNGWFYSHNFDQRLIVADGAYYTLAHGDAYPRALGFSKWTDSGGGKANLVNTRYHDIPGKSGDNTTHCQTGGLVALNDKTFAVLFATSNERPAHDVCLKILSDSGKVMHQQWLTSYGEDRYAAYPRIARYGQDILLAWEEVVSGSHQSTLQMMLLDASAESSMGPMPVSDAHVSPFYDIVALDDGSVVWATASGGGSIRIYRVYSPQTMEERLVKSLAERSAQTADTKRLAKPGALAALDKKVIAKLAGLDRDGNLPGGALRLSKVRSPLRLVQAGTSGQLTFGSGIGSRAKTVVLDYGNLPLRDKAALVLVLARHEPTNKTLYGVAGFYLDCAGDTDAAEKCYDRAGTDVATTFAALMEPE